MDNETWILEDNLYKSDRKQRKAGELGCISEINKLKIFKLCGGSQD